MITSTVRLSDPEFVELTDIIYKNSGILFSEQKKYLIENRLSKRLADLNFSSFKDYIYYLKYDIKKRLEMEVLINLITINETYFLRERGQMDYLITFIIPELLKQGKRNIRIWSVPCSTGEEPYSIAILLHNAGIFSKANIEIVATDINTSVVEIAKRGEYRLSSFRGCPPDFAVKNFDFKDGSYFVKDEIKRHIKFNTGNIVSPLIASMVGKMDVIFCRNVLIYFDIEGKKKSINAFKNILVDHGYLCLGHSETLSKISEDFTMKNFGTGILYLKK